MSIERFFTTTFSVERQEWSGDSSGLVSQDSFDGHIQQASAEMAESIGLRWTTAYTIWCPVDTDVQDGDRLTVGDDVYSVRAIQKNEVGNNQHLEIVAEKHD